MSLPKDTKQFTDSYLLIISGSILLFIISISFVSSGYKYFPSFFKPKNNLYCKYEYSITISPFLLEAKWPDL